MTTRNDVTGDKLQSKVTTDDYRNNYDSIFGKKEAPNADKPRKDESPKATVRG